MTKPLPEKRPKIFYLFRHGETDWNQAGRMQGSVDIPLNKFGIAQAEAMRAFFDGLTGELISSPLSRASMTSRIALRVSETSVNTLRTDARFAESRLGKAEGLTREELIISFGESAWDKWIGLGDDSWHAKFPDGESKAEVRDRALAALDELTSEPHETFFISTHGGLLRRLLHHFHPDETLPIDVGNGYVFKFIFENGRWSADRKPIFTPKRF